MLAIAFLRMDTPRLSATALEKPTVPDEFDDDLGLGWRGTSLKSGDEFVPRMRHTRFGWSMSL